MFCNKKITMEVVSVVNDVLTFKQLKDEFNSHDRVAAIIRNVKTGEEFKCNSVVNKEFISIELGNIKRYFTDYEGAIFLSYDNTDSFFYSPVVINQNTVNNTIQNNYNWYLRVIENGELRLSTVYKK